MFNVTDLIQTGGLALIAAIIFAESGMMVGFFFPGDTLLFSAGVFAAQGKFSVVTAIIVIAAAAIIGDNIGYQIGKSLGPRLFRKKDSVIFRKEYIEKAEVFYTKYGSKAMLIAHFVPIIRAFAPVTAGAGKMRRLTFFIYDAIGDIAWAASITLLGWWLGSRVPGVEKFVEPVLLGVIVLAFVPAFYHAFKDPKIRAATKRAWHRLFRKAN